MAGEGRKRPYPRHHGIGKIRGVNPYHFLAGGLTVLFALGVAGCAITIPIAAWKFFSVLLERDEGGENPGRNTLQLD